MYGMGDLLGKLGPAGTSEQFGLETTWIFTRWRGRLPWAVANIQHRKETLGGSSLWPVVEAVTQIVVMQLHGVLHETALPASFLAVVGGGVAG